MGRHFPRTGAPAAALPLAGGRASRELSDPRLRRPVPAGQAGDEKPGAGRQALAAAPGPGLHQHPQGRGPASAAHRYQRRPLPAPDAAGLPALSGALRAQRLWWISPSCCCGPWSCGAIAPMCWSTTDIASSTSWSTSFRTPTPSSTPGCACSPGTRTSCSWWGTTISPSTAGAAPGSSTCSASWTITRALGCCAWSRTTALRATSSTPPTH